MNNLAKICTVSLVLMAFSGPTFAWGSWSPWVGYSGAQYCNAKRSTGSVRNGKVWQSSTTSCGGGYCFGIGWANGQNVTSMVKGADMALQARHASGSPYYHSQYLNLPQNQTFSMVFNSSSDFDITSQCQVQ